MIIACLKSADFVLEVFTANRLTVFLVFFGGLDNLNAVSNSDMNSERTIISFFAFVRVVSSLAIGRQPHNSSSRVMIMH